jgi:hypothetical protein
MRIMMLVCACALSIFALEAVFSFPADAQNATPGMGGAPSGGIGGGSTAGMSGGPPIVVKPQTAHPEQDPGARSARSIECAQRADAQGLQGKLRKHFLHECKSGA